MDRDNLLKTIAETGYNVGFGAKKHFATFDIVQKAPGIIGFLGIAVGIFSLVFDQLAAQLPAATLAVLGVIGLYISLRDSQKADYEAAGKTLTRLYNRLRDLSRNVECGAEIDPSLAALHDIENEYYAASISEQILLSDWYAHYKFFAQQQIDWIEKHRTFTLRDKVPLSIRLMGVVLLPCVIVGLIYFAWAKRHLPEL
jgi:hypothetical protein